MKAHWRRWLQQRVAPRPGEPRRITRTRRISIFLAFILLLGELVVAVRWSGSTGLIMLVSTAGLAIFAVRGLEDFARESTLDRESDEELAMRFMLDKETRLPNRNQLIDQLTRDIARAARYSYDMTLVIVNIDQFDEIRNSWGVGTAGQAVIHVSETLGRVTRSSDFVARLDEQRFAVVLIQCNARQAGLFGERLALAVSNRPLKSTERVRVPLYVNVETSPLQYDATRFRGPLEFLSLAGGDVIPEMDRTRMARNASSQPGADAASLRRQLVQDYYPEGKMQDFADAYREQRTRNRHVG
jgi:diguanylate cyclase (GGDEF)-like protein